MNIASRPDLRPFVFKKEAWIYELTNCRLDYPQEALDRIYQERLSNHYHPKGEHRGLVVYYWPKRLKSGKDSKCNFIQVSAWYTEVRQCAYCGVWGSPRKVKDNSIYLGDWRREDYTSYSPLCTSCWNKLKPLQRRYDYVNQTEHLINRLARRRKTMPGDLPPIKDLDSFRKYLCNAIERVDKGDLDTVRALRIAKLAAQVNESLRVELAAARLVLEKNEEPPKLGKLPIGIKGFLKNKSHK